MTYFHQLRDDYLKRMQRRLEEKIAENKIYHGIKDDRRARSVSEDDDAAAAAAVADDEDTDFELDNPIHAVDGDSVLGHKETCVLEV